MTPYSVSYSVGILLYARKSRINQEGPHAHKMRNAQSQQSVAFWKIIPSRFSGTNCPLLQLPVIKLMPPIAKVAHRQADSALSGF